MDQQHATLPEVVPPEMIIEETVMGPDCDTGMYALEDYGAAAPIYQEMMQNQLLNPSLAPTQQPATIYAPPVTLVATHGHFATAGQPLVVHKIDFTFPIQLPHEYVYSCLANYHVLKRIGKGQFSEVYKAKCLADDGRIVALKKVQVLTRAAIRAAYCFLF